MSFSADLALKHRLRLWEPLPLVSFLLVPLFAPEYLALATQVEIFVIFTISLDLLVGYAGVVTLGHAVFFGVGAYTAGLLSVHGWSEPITGVLIAAAAAAAVGAAFGAIVLRTSRFTLLMLSLSAVFLASEVANKAGRVTGGVDGLVGINTSPLLGRYEFDLLGRTGFAYVFLVLAAAFAAARWLTHTPFGQAIVAIRDNPVRADAIGMSVLPRLVAIYTISSALAGIAGALQAQVTQFVGLNAIGFELSANVLVMLALGGAGRLYGAFLGPAVFLVAQDVFARTDPTLSQLWIGVLVVAIVLFAPDGLIGVVRRVRGGRP